MAGKGYRGRRSRALKGGNLRLSPAVLRNLQSGHALDPDNLRTIVIDHARDGAPQVTRVKSVADTDANILQTNDATCVADRHEGLRGASAADLNRCAKVIADPQVALGDRAACAGAAPGQTLEPGAATAALGLIARSARDLFGSIRAADDFLKGDNFDDTGVSAKMLVSLGRGTDVIARLDELRYGTQG